MAKYSSRCPSRSPSLVVLSPGDDDPSRLEPSKLTCNSRYRLLFWSWSNNRLAIAANGASLIICSDFRPEPWGTWSTNDAETSTYDLICQGYGQGEAFYAEDDVTIAQDVEELVRRAVAVGGRLGI